ncbi:exopolysaccharide synthesis, ExoD [Celeribacter indicus]|uniref:Exopolysaccharide synthesis, ExoD n=1 Tax=Celeribacter indicus TaxID=1208324 RepID=A0A0B5E024_9RHOB|nr:exopolysaccharide synthesis, ExoD [Celeribacter indicus]
MGEIVDRLADAAERGEEVALENILDTLGRASFVPMLMAAALAVVTPLSGIPLFSSLCGITIALISAQMVIGRDCLWMPRWLGRRTVPAARLKTATDALRKPAGWLDRNSGERLRPLVSPPMDRVISLICMLCGLTMPLLELVPFTSSILGTAVAFLSLTLLVQDGLFALIGFSVIGVAVGVGIYVI